MAYCTLEDLQSLLSPAELAELTAEIGEDPDSAVIADAIAAADALINGYCEQRYGKYLPFNPVPEIIRAMSADIALYHLFSRRTTMPEVRRYKYEDAVSFLKRVAQGLANIPGLPQRDTALPRFYAV